jgi:hypothetical protein
MQRFGSPLLRSPSFHKSANAAGCRQSIQAFVRQLLVSYLTARDSARYGSIGDFRGTTVTDTAVPRGRQVPSTLSCWLAFYESEFPTPVSGRDYPLADPPTDTVRKSGNHTECLVVWLDCEQVVPAKSRPSSMPGSRRLSDASKSCAIRPKKKCAACPCQHHLLSAPRAVDSCGSAP